MVDTVKATINGQEYSLTYSEATGKYEATLTAPSITSYNQTGGYYGVSVTATDTATNSTTVNSDDATLGSALRLVVKEKVKPTIGVTNPGEGANIVSATPTISIQLRDEENGSGIDISTFALRINGGSAINSTATGMTVTPATNGYDVSYVVQSALSSGSNTITIDVADNDENSANQFTRTFTVNTAAPILNITSPANDITTNQTDFALNGTVNDDQLTSVVVTATLNGVDVGAITHDTTTGAFTKTVTLTEGENTIIVTATDAGGLTASITRVVTLDTVAPVITAVTIAPNPVDAGQTYIISVTVTD
jgi:hypothetical protein